MKEIKLYRFDGFNLTVCTAYFNEEGDAKTKIAKNKKHNYICQVSNKPENVHGNALWLEEFDDEKAINLFSAHYTQLALDAVDKMNLYLHKLDKLRRVEACQQK